MSAETFIYLMATALYAATSSVVQTITANMRCSTTLQGVEYDCDPTPDAGQPFTVHALEDGGVESTFPVRIQRDDTGTVTITPSEV